MTEFRDIYGQRIVEHAKGALTGLALGDALGMPTQSMSYHDIVHYYGGPIHELRDAVAEQPIAPNMTAGAVTDDTEQAFLLAHRLIEGHGELDNLAYAHDLLDWEADMQARGSLDLLGPSTKTALAALAAGTPIDQTGRTGTTNGGAMRAAPIGIAFSPNAPDRLLARMARESCIVTHNTVQGIQATTLVAAAVSFGVGGITDPLHHAVAYVQTLPQHGAWSAKASVLARVTHFVDWAFGKGSRLDDDEFAAVLRRDCGTSVEANESVAAAFAIAARFEDRPTEALCFAASLGGDTDTIGAMAGAILGAQHGPTAFQADITQQVTDRLASEHHLDIDATAEALCAIRIATLGDNLPD